MSVQHYALSIYQHTNASNPSDAGIGFWLCYQPAQGTPLASVPNSVPVPVPPPVLASAGAAAQPYATLGAAQSAGQLVIIWFNAQNATVVGPGNDSLVYGPVFV